MPISSCFVSSYSCFFVPKVNSKCFLFEHDTKNFKGPDGTLLCYKTAMFTENARVGLQLPDDGRREKQVGRFEGKSTTFLCVRVN